MKKENILLMARKRCWLFGCNEEGEHTVNGPGKRKYVCKPHYIQLLHFRLGDFKLKRANIEGQISRMEREYSMLKMNYHYIESLKHDFSEEKKENVE